MAIENNKYTHISTATTTIIRGISGKLTKVTINTPASGSLTLYDNASAASGTVIAIIDTNPTNPVTLEYSADVVNGIVALTSGTSDITILSTNQSN